MFPRLTFLVYFLDKIRLKSIIWNRTIPPTGVGYFLDFPQLKV